jgi:hypothetical protein
MADTRWEYAHLTWDKETDDGYTEWTAFTDYSETLTIVQDSVGTFQAIYQVNGPADDPVLSEVDLGTFRTYIRARQALANYVVDYWGSYRAWEEQAEMEMAQEQEGETHE